MEIENVFTELPDGDIWLSEYHAPDVRFSFKSEVLGIRAVTIPENGHGRK